MERTTQQNRFTLYKKYGFGEDWNEEWEEDYIKFAKLHFYDHLADPETQVEIGGHSEKAKKYLYEIFENIELGLYDDILVDSETYFKNDDDE